VIPRASLGTGPLTVMTGIGSSYLTAPAVSPLMSCFCPIR